MSLFVATTQQDHYILEILAALVEANQHLEQQLEQRTLELQRLTQQLQAEVQHHQETEAALRDSEEQLRQIFECSNDAIFVIDPEADRILEANPQAIQRLEYSRNELLSSVRVSAVHSHEIEKMREFSQIVLEEGRSWTNELSCLSKSGNVLPSEISASVIDFQDRKCILALIRDITDRKRAEKALRESEARFRTLVENAADVILVIDPDGCVVDANHRACEKLGYTYEELINLCIHQLDAKYTAEELAKLRQQFTIGVPVILETIHQRKDGTTFPVEASICLFESGDRWLELALVRDITERKQAEQAMARLAEIGELATMIVHEVRNPLTTVLMGLNAFRKLELPDPAQQRLDLALEEAERLKRLFNEILLYAKAPSLQTIRLELNEFLTSIVESLRDLPIIKNRKIQLRSSVPPVWVVGDRDKLKQVFINLIKNACEAIDDHQTITWNIQPCQLANQVQINIHNGGNPIPHDILTKIGTPFFTTKPNGNGLGLAIVKQIIAAHNGELIITSEATLGTTVTIQLPIATV